MTSAIDAPNALTPLPDHTQLPESDGTFVFAEPAGGKNFQEHPQSILLIDSIKPILQKRHPDGLWQGEYYNIEFPWLRWWDLQGNLLLTGEERADRLTAQLRRRGAACR